MLKEWFICDLKEKLPRILLYSCLWEGDDSLGQTTALDFTADPFVLFGRFSHACISFKKENTVKK